MPHNFELLPGKKAYFASDIHLGLYPLEKSAKRERLFVQWLNEIKTDAQYVFLLGDIFDFWHEYKKAIPRGYTRFLGKICELTDAGIQVHFFTGNHDVWMYDYLPAELGIVLHTKPIEAVINKSSFYLGHGDGVSKADRGYRILKSIFANKFLQWMFALIHPNVGLAFGQAWSKSSRLSKGISEKYLGEEKEHQIVFAKETLNTKHFDYFVFGHRHLAMDFKLNENSRLINLGEWIFSNTYAVFNGQDLALNSYKKL